MRLSGKKMQGANKFNYLGVMISTHGGIGGGELGHRVLEGKKVMGTMGKLWKNNMLCRKVKGNNMKVV